MIHGLFENVAVRHGLVAGLRKRKGLPEQAPEEEGGDEYDRIAAVVRDNVDMALLNRLVGR
jgi:cobyric acid synthase